VNILYVSEYYYPRLAGGEIVSRQYCEGLASRGHKVYVITSRLPDTEEHEVVGGVEIFRPIKSAKISVNSSMQGARSLFNRATFAIKLFSVLKQFIRSHKIDVIYNVAYVPTFPAGWAASGARIPSITAVHSIWGTTWFKLTNPITALLIYLLEIFVIRFGNHPVIQCPSKYAADRVRRHTVSEIVVIPPPLEMQEITEIKETTDTKLVRQELGITGNQQFLLFVGTLTPIKNVYGLVTALSDSKADFKLVLLGEGPERRKIESLLQERSIAHKVLLAGQRSHHDTLRMIYACDSMILPSKIETFGIVVIEALAMNRTVIATPVGCVTEISSPNLHVIHDLNEINKIIETNPSASTDNIIIEQFSIPRVITQLEQLLENALHKNLKTENKSKQEKPAK
jgi:glycosyltransferase involved in cell wall biosynthesis